jgi:hypothetical protein
MHRRENASAIDEVQETAAPGPSHVLTTPLSDQILSSFFVSAF